MKTGPIHLTIGDLHGRNCWHFAASNWVQRSPAHVVVFQGNYVDSFDISLADQAENLRRLIAFKQQHPGQVVLLLGNHDAHYIWPDAPRGSGFKPINHAQLYPIFNEHRALFRIAYELHSDGQKYLWTHAGVSWPWIDSTRTLLLPTPDKARPYTLADVLNLLTESAEHRAILLRVGSDRGGQGAGGPLWVDMQTMTDQPIMEYHQLVGHTALPEPGATVVGVREIPHTSVTFCDYNEFTLGIENVRPDFFYQL